MIWFRMYSSVLHDPKVQRLPPALFKHWVNLLCLANENDTRGMLPCIDDIAFALRVKPSEADKILTKLRRAGLVDQTQEGRDFPHNWPQRQRESDDSAPRVRAHRERKAGNDEGSTPSRNGDVTLQQQAVDTDTDTELDIDTEKDLSNSSVSATSDTPTPPKTMDTIVPSKVRTSKKTTSSKPENVTPLPTERARIPTWDALVDIFGYAPSTKPERSNWGKCVKELNGVNATPEDMKVRAARYVARYPNARLTPNALVSHWGELAIEQSRGTASPPSQPRAMAANGGSYYRTRAPEPEPYFEPYDMRKHNPWKRTSAPPAPSPVPAPVTTESE